MHKIVSLVSAVVSVGLTAFLGINLVNGEPIREMWVAVFFLVMSLVLTALSISLLKQK